MTNEQIQQGIKALQEISSKSFDWYQLIYPIISGVIVTAIIGLFSFFRNRRRHQNILICIAAEMFINFSTLKVNNNNQESDYILVLSFNNWDNGKLEIAHLLPEKLVGAIELCYITLRPMNGVSAKFIKQGMKDQGSSFGGLVKAINENLIELMKHVKYRDKDFSSVEERIKSFVLEKPKAQFQ